MDLKLEVVVVRLSDVDRAERFYETLGFRMDIDYSADGGFRVVQLTPPGSQASIFIGASLPSAAPGSLQGLHPVVFDIESARTDLLGRGVEVSEILHDAGGVFHHAADVQRVAGADPRLRVLRRVRDPDDNGWVLQEVKTRAAGR